MIWSVSRIVGVGIWFTFLFPILKVFFGYASWVNPDLATISSIGLYQVHTDLLLVEHWGIEHLIQTTLTALLAFTFYHPRHSITAP